MTHPIYTVGYLGWKQPELIAALRRLNGLLVDIRFTPWSRNPQWIKANLEKLLGNDYVHIKALGNAEHKTGGMRIFNYDMGVAFIASNADVRPIVLMCACKDNESCHREVVAKMLRKAGYTVQELEHSA